jgi:hypothetical protein
MGRLGALASLFSILIGLLLGSGNASAYTFGPNVQQIGAEQTVFDWSTMNCDGTALADSPARAWRDSSSKVHLLISGDANRAMVGSSLNTVAVDCPHVLLSSDLNADPSTYDDHEWIHSPYTVDGIKVSALVHDEYHGWEHPGQCSSQGHPNRPKFGTIPIAGFSPGCWYNAVTYATSTDGGYTFTHATPPAHLVASSSYQYVQSDGPYGYFTPSNIVRRSDGYFYAMVQAEAHGAQQVGTCVMRTKNPANLSSWRAWNGTAYSVQFIDPYTNPDPPENHVCAPVAFNEIEKMVQSLTYNSFFGKYLLVGVTGLYDPIRQTVVYGVYYSTSSDLITWSTRQLVMEAELPWTYLCGDDNPISYTAYLNPAATDRNFGTTGQKGYLYFTRFNIVNCVGSNDDDLIRIPIKFLSPTATGH